MSKVIAVNFVLVLVLVLVLSVSAFGGANMVAKACVHVEAHGSRTCAKNFPTITSCWDIVSTEPTPDVDAFPVFYDLVEYQGFDYGMDWPGLYSCAFTSCSDLAIGTITWPGDGISHAWYVCQPGPVVVTGWGWIYDYGLICIVPHPTAGAVNVGDCQGQLDIVCAACCGGTGGYIGDDPCSNFTGAERSTWGGIKYIFK